MTVDTAAAVATARAGYGRTHPRTLIMFCSGRTSLTDPFELITAEWRWTPPLTATISELGTLVIEPEAGSTTGEVAGTVRAAVVGGEVAGTVRAAVVGGEVVGTVGAAVVGGEVVGAEFGGAEFGGVVGDTDPGVPPSRGVIPSAG